MAVAGDFTVGDLLHGAVHGMEEGRRFVGAGHGCQFNWCGPDNSYVMDLRKLIIWLMSCTVVGSSRLMVGGWTGRCEVKTALEQYDLQGYDVYTEAAAAWWPCLASF